ncbi:hypothetical protein ABZX63_40910, partial [Streptomyces tendae]
FLKTLDNTKRISMATDDLGQWADALLTAAEAGRPHPCDAAFGLRVTEILAEAEALLTDRR